MGEIRALEPSRWAHRTQLLSRPTTDATSPNAFVGQQADYWICGHRSLPKPLHAELRQMAPAFRGYFLDEVVLNRYTPGQGMAEHIDQSLHRINLAVPLTEDGDGIWIDGLWWPDRAGRGYAFNAPSLPHYVPPARRDRWVLIYLYE